MYFLRSIPGSAFFNKLIISTEPYLDVGNVVGVKMLQLSEVNAQAIISSTDLLISYNGTDWSSDFFVDLSYADLVYFDLYVKAGSKKSGRIQVDAAERQY